MPENRVYLVFDPEGLNGFGLYKLLTNFPTSPHIVVIKEGTEQNRKKLRQESEKLQEIWYNKRKKF